MLGSLRRELQRSLTSSATLALRSASSRPRNDPQAVGGLVADSLQQDADTTAAAIASQLDPLSKQALLKALAPGEASTVQSLEDVYVESILKQADFKDGDGLLNRAELKAALQADRAYVQLKSDPPGPPSYRTLALLAAAAGLPFVGFGFVDNCIMLIAGEEIDAMFGAKLGLTTMASAGLGNMVSDVCGIGLAGQIEAQARKLKWVKSVPPLTGQQRRLASTKAAKFGGSAIGVCIGCLLGMSPLLLISHS